MKKYHNLSASERKVYDWEKKWVIGGGYFYPKLKSDRTLPRVVRSGGYEFYRISPRPTRKFGLSYRKVFAGYMEEKYIRTPGMRPQPYPHARWDLIGYVKNRKGIKSGTRTIVPLSSYAYKKSAVRAQLMLKPRKVKKRRKKIR